MIKHLYSAGTVAWKLFLSAIVSLGYLGEILNPLTRRKAIWLIGENRGDCVCDNGYYFYKHCRLFYPADEVYFVINRGSPLYSLLSNHDNNVLIYGSIRHAMVFSLAGVYFYTHTYSDVIYRRIYEVFGQNKKLVFLHHGVLGFKRFNDFYQEKRDVMDLFTVGNRVEADILINHAGVSSDKVKVTGYARYDYLYDKAVPANPKIIYIPTYRDWILDEFYSSEFYRTVKSLLNNEDLGDLLLSNNIILNVYFHRYLHSYISELNSRLENIKILGLGETSPTQLISECNLMITDYSSVAWDFFYLNKPVLFYRFDLQDYLMHRDSYIPLDHEEIGEIVYTETDLIKRIGNYCLDDFSTNPRFQHYRETISPDFDHNNCGRIYTEVLKLENR